jgi:hypothetical protein
MDLDERRAMIEADRVLLSDAKSGSVAHPMIATHITDHDLAKLPLVRIEKAARSEQPQRVRFQIKAVLPYQVEDVLLIEDLRTGALRALDPSKPLLKSE